MTPPPLAICLFGPLRVTVRGAPLPRVRTRSVEWLLALLTLRHGRPVQRAWLAGTLWPESSSSRALQSLRDDLLRLRQALGAESSRIQAPARDSLTIDLTGAVVDLLEFDAAIRAGDEEAPPLRPRGGTHCHASGLTRLGGRWPSWASPLKTNGPGAAPGAARQRQHCLPCRFGGGEVSFRYLDHVTPLLAGDARGPVVPDRIDPVEDWA
jgi:hypothetical protein